MREGGSICFLPGVVVIFQRVEILKVQATHYIGLHYFRERESIENDMIRIDFVYYGTA